MARYDLSDAEWRLIAPLLSDKPGGVARVDNPRVLNGILYLLRIGSWEVDTGGFDAEERLSIDAHRWWSVAELDATDETVYPEELADLLRRCLALPGTGSRC